MDAKYFNINTLISTAEFLQKCLYEVLSDQRVCESQWLAVMWIHIHIHDPLFTRI